MAGGFYSSLAGFVLRRRWLVLAGYLLMTVGLGWSGSRITVRSDITDLLPQGVASGDDLRFYLARFGSSDPLFLGLRAAALPDQEGEAAERLEEAAASLTAELEATGLFRSVRYGFGEEEGLAMARAAMARLPVLAPVERIDDLRGRVSPQGIRAALRRLRTAAAGPLPAGPRKALAAEDPLGLLALLPGARPAAGPPVRADAASGLFLSEDGAALLVIATPLAQPQDVEFSRKVLEAVEEAERRGAARAPGVAFDHAGAHLFAVQDEARIRHDITATASISAGALVALFALMLRSLWLLLILMAPLALSTLWTLGVAAFHPGHLNVVTIAFAAILLGMGDDSLTHLYLRFREAIALGQPRAQALRAAMASTGPSILLATLTSGLAFASLAFVEFRGLSELGIIAAIGLLTLLVSVLFLFPCLLSLAPAGVGQSPPRIPSGAFVAFHRWAARHRAAVLTGAAALTLAAGAACLRLEFSSDLRALRGDDPAQERLERVLSPFGGMAEPIHLIHEGASREQALRSAEKLAPVCDRLRAEGLVTGCSSVVAWLSSEATQRARFAATSGIAWDQVARELRAAAAELDLNESFFSPFLANLSRYARWEEVRIDPDAADPRAREAPALSGAAVATTIFPAPGRAASMVLARAREIDPSAAGPPARAASIGLVVADLGGVIESDFRRASLIALGAVVLASLAAFRSLSRLLLAGLPVMVGCLLMLGGLALLGVPINLMNLVATPLVFGLGIDFGVYIVNRHEEERRADIPKVLRHTGGAILLTGLTTMAGFGSLLSAQFAGLRSMGWVAVLGIGGCLLAALAILPLLLPRPR